MTPTFKKGDRVVFIGGDGRRHRAPGTVLEDSDKGNWWTYVQYDGAVPGFPSCSMTCRLDYHTNLKAETQSRAFCVEIPDPKKFLIISEGTALDEELMRAGAFRIEANGHYGSAYYFSLAEEDVPNLGRYLQIIERHLALLDMEESNRANS